MSNWTLLGAACFGVVIGWLVYYINRYRKSDVQLGDLTTVIGIVGGAGVTALFGGGDKDLFGAYGIGLFVGFFAYFVSLIFLVVATRGVFGASWFLDGRRKRPGPDEEIQGGLQPPVRNMDAEPTVSQRLGDIQDRLAIIETSIGKK